MISPSSDERQKTPGQGPDSGAHAPRPHAVPETADEPVPDAHPASHDFSKESMIIEPPTFKEMPDLGDVQTPRFWNLLWFNLGRPIVVGALWFSGLLLVTHVAINWNDLPHGVLVTAVSIAALLLLVSVWRRYAPSKPRKNIDRTHGTELATFFGTDKDAHRAVRHSKRIDAYFDGARIGLVSEKQAQLTPGTLPFTAKRPDGRPLRTLNPEGAQQAREAGFPLEKQ